jgi:chemotaxis protein CheZ
MQTADPAPDANRNSIHDAAAGVNPDIHQSIGALTRQLHNALQALGLTDKFKGLAGELPDAKSRLSYISRLTGEAAEKVLNRVDLAKADHDLILAQTRAMSQRLNAAPAAMPSPTELLAFLASVEGTTRQADVHLTEIMMAQDFHDLTGQVIAKVVTLAANVEEQLVQLLIQTAPHDAATKPTPVAAASEAPAPYQPALSGPAMNPQDNPDVVSGQSEVDDLLASLGF